VTKKIVVCTKCKNAACVTDLLEAHSDVDIRPVRCQKICHGPVVGLKVRGTMEWFERVDDLPSVAALLRLTRGSRRKAKIPKPLRKHRVRRYSGRPPRT
jgi:hypothetical protein